MSKKINEFQTILDASLANDGLLYVVGDPFSGLLFKPTQAQIKNVMFGSLSNGAIMLADTTNNKLKHDVGYFSWNTSAKAFTVIGSGVFGSLGSVVSIPAPVNLGYVRRIDLDQPNTQILIKKGNADIGGGFARPTQNDGELRITSGATVDGSSNPLDGYITFYCTGAEVSRLSKNGFTLPKLTTSQRDALSFAQTGQLIYNDTTDALNVYNGSGWIVVGAGGGGGDLLAANNLSDLASPATSLSNLGGSTAGKNLFTISNPGAISFLRFNADNTVSELSASAFRTAIGAGTGNGNLVAANNLSDVVSAATSRTNLGGTTVGSNIFTVTNPSAIRFIRINANNSVSLRTAAEIMSDIYDYSIHTITFSTTPTLDGNVGNNFKITLTNNVTSLTLSNLVVGKDYYLTMIQDPTTGGHTVTFPANSIAPLGAFSSGTTLANTSTINAQDDVRIRYDGTKYRIYLDRDLK